MDDNQATCGIGLAEHAALPATTGRLMAATAAILENHQKALLLDDPNSRLEYDAYVKLAHGFREIAETLQRTADQMTGYRHLPMGKHDERAMTSADAVDAFSQFVKMERELLNLLQTAVPRDQTMLDAMHR